MKKRIIPVLLMLILASVWLPALADTLTYSIFDVEIPFKSIVDCQRYSSNDWQVVYGFKYPYVDAVSTSRFPIYDANELSDVKTNPQRYYYQFVESENNTDNDSNNDDNSVGLKLCRKDNPNDSYTVSKSGRIASYGNGCFLYISKDHDYGYFVSFLDKEYHMEDDVAECDQREVYTDYPEAAPLTNCAKCGCGEVYKIVEEEKNYGQGIAMGTLTALPMQEGLVEIKHDHDFTNGQCPCGAQPISFGSNGGSGEMTQEPIKAGDVLVLPECEFTPPKGQTFVCWLVKGEFEIIGKDTRAFSWIAHAKADVKEQLLYPGETIKVLGPIEIEAQWQKTQEMPHTGDDSRAALWLCLLGMAGAGLYLLRKRAYN